VYVCVCVCVWSCGCVCKQDKASENATAHATQKEGKSERMCALARA